MTSQSSTLLTFHNPGLIDIRGAFITGLSAKEQGTAAIGKFGTGLKYAIACILRWGGSITIMRGEKAYAFGSKPIDFRGTEHQLIFVQSLEDGEQVNVDLGFTTHYGTNWKPWQVYRELLSNALDEGGDVMQGRAPASPDHTQIVVQCAELLEPHADRASIILPSDLFYTEVSAGVSIREAFSSHLYYKGVRVHDVASCLTFNIGAALRVDLTEEREVSNDGRWQARDLVGKAIQAATSEKIILRALQSKADFDKNLSFNSWNPTSPEFLNVAERLFARDPRSHVRLREVLAQHRPEAVRARSISIRPIWQKQIAKALRLLAQMDVEVEGPSAPPIDVRDLGETTLACYDKAAHTISLSPNLFEQGTKQVVSTLYEEFLHAYTHKQDCTYDLQTMLFNKIISLYEEHVFGEPI